MMKLLLLKLGEALGAVALGIVFFGVFAPVALVMTLAGREAFERT
jgi:hypothetical protein